MAQRVQALQTEARELENEILALVRQQAPELLDLLDHHRPDIGQLVSPGAIPLFAGVSPIPASSGLTNRHSLNRSGDRHLDRAMHTITLIRMRLDPSTKTYLHARSPKGRSPVTRSQIFKALEHTDQNRLDNTKNSPTRLGAT
ncbi:transposase [Streptomyces sp. NPDC058434]|uniref:transposase n=1 Tax=Streptomyces sp. NPDC058434 TaxID=3346498 RepID=UPI00365326EB